MLNHLTRFTHKEVLYGLPETFIHKVMAAICCHRKITPLNLMLTLSSCLNRVEIEFNSCFNSLVRQINAPKTTSKKAAVHSCIRLMLFNTIEFLA